MSSTISPNMNLIVPTVGSEPGPTYADDVNASLNLIDGHDHSSGSGVPINPAGIDINTSLPFGNNPATALSAAAFTAQSAQTITKAIYVKGVDLYYRDGNNNEIQLTSGGSIVGTAGSITGLPSGTAGVSYSAGIYTFAAATNTPANIQMGSALLGNNSALSKYLTLSPPAAMAANFTLTLPSVPASQSFVTIDASGNFGTPITYVGGITGTNIAAGTIAGSNLIAGTITATQLASDAVTTAKILDGAVTAAKITPTFTLGSAAQSGITVTGTYVSGATVSALGTGHMIQVALYAGTIGFTDNGGGGVVTYQLSRWDGASHTDLATIAIDSDNGVGGPAISRAFAAGPLSSVLTTAGYQAGAFMYYDTVSSSGSYRYDIKVSFGGSLGSGGSAYVSTSMALTVI